MGALLVPIITGFAQFYGIVIIIYVLMSWFPVSGGLYEVYRVLGSLVEPYLGIFRRFIPPIGGLDLSPIIAFFVLEYFVRLVLVPLVSRL